MSLASLLKIQPPDHPVRQWHVSAPVDLMGYAFSWAWVFIPLLLLGDARWDYMVYYLLIVAVTDVHRHFGLPYVYMDREIRRRYPIRFYLFPAALLAAWLVSPWLGQTNYHVSGVQVLALLSWIFLLAQVLRLDGADAITGNRLAVGFGAAFLGGLILTGVVSWNTVDPGWWWLSGSWILSYLLSRRARSVVPFMIFGLGVIAAFLGDAISRLGGGQGIWIIYILHTVAVFAGLWNFYHVYMQKYGIMRLYNAKSGSETKVAGWVDKIMLFAWLPLYLAWLGPLYREVALEKLGRARAVLPPILDALESVMSVTIPITIAFVVVAIAIWIVSEWRSNRMRNMPRLWMFIGQNALAVSFLIFNPVKAYLAFAFSHAVEYMIFVWAFQRRRYDKPLSHKPLLQRVLRHPATAYLAFILLIGGGFTFFKFWGDYVFPSKTPPEAFGQQTRVWLLYWGVYQSMQHFYFDGFLWKMRSASVRANI